MSPMVGRGSSSKTHLDQRTPEFLAVKEEPSSGGSGPRRKFFPSLTLKPESIERNERKQRLMQHTIEEERRERDDGRRHYINVNEDGRPYGLGVTSWNDALTKVVRGLDPSYIDIRHQPYHLMETLTARLTEDFEYSAEINRTWLRKRIGGALSSYRHELIKMIKAKEDRPPWVKESVWTKLAELEGSDKFKRKSEQMRYANSCRRTKGRTGPLGEVGITERMRERLGRYPEPEEIQQEMLRDKGYSRRTRKTMTATLEDSDSEDQEMQGSGGSGSSIQVGEEQFPQSPIPAHTPVIGDVPAAKVSVLSSAAGVGSGGEAGVQNDANPLIQLLLQQIKDLKESEYGKSEDVLVVVDSLMQQVMTLRSRGSRGQRKCVVDSFDSGEVDISATRTEPLVCEDPPVEAVSNS